MVRGGRGSEVIRTDGGGMVRWLEDFARGALEVREEGAGC